ncbi:MAG TPA: DUF2090 domain-containing protein [Candidatus Woesebacteria bacterium]|jgi:5-dehydro-2-deoxygluconokinase|nr:DUF2090 domain-containing protein [Candidatus Woesebacteria bacterium]
MKNFSKLYLLPFDHRSSFEKLVDKEKIPEAKMIIYEAFLQIRENYPHPEFLGILVDNTYGRMILDDAQTKGITRAVCIEKSGQPLFDFDQENWMEILDEIKPEIIKVLVRYNPEEKENNSIQLEKLAKVFDYCQSKNLPLLFELLTGEAGKTATAIKEIKQKLQPTIWKLEGVEAGQWEEILAVTQEDKIIVLGRGENADKVKQWITEAKKYPQIIGFAIGRTVFLEPIQKWVNGELNHNQARDQISQNYQSWIKLWEEIN